MQAILKPSTVVPYKKIAVIGFGLTGQSVIRYLKKSTTELIVMDTRHSAPNKKELKRLFPKARIVTGGLDQHTLETADMVVVSPGVDIRATHLRDKIGPQTELIGDIELFVRYANAPIIAITGSNGKSTVATLVERLITAAKKTVLLGGNIGIPALDLFAQATPDVYVLELSSFQLETTSSLAADVAVVLNVSEDHMDRYGAYQLYLDAKLRIYRNAIGEVINRNDPSAPQITLAHSISFGLNVPEDSQAFGVLKKGDKTWLAQGDKTLLETSKLSIKGQQNWLNVLASFAIVQQFGLSINAAMIKAACDFEGLPHRCEQIGERDGVMWVNDSKGTNVGATLAAISGFTQPKIMIMGGQSKNADLSALLPVMDKGIRHLILMGEDAGKIASVFDGKVSFTEVESLEAAVLLAKKKAKKGDVVLLSPACASFDMYSNYLERGDDFRALVNEYVLAEGDA